MTENVPGIVLYKHGRLQEMRGPIVLCKTCSVLLCVLEQPRIDNSSVGPNESNWSNWRKFGPVYKVCVFHFIGYPRWPSETVMCSDWPKLKTVYFPSTAPIKHKLYINNHWMFLFKISFFLMFIPHDKVFTQDHVGKYENIIFSEITEMIEPILCMNDH